MNGSEQVKRGILDTAASLEEPNTKPGVWDSNGTRRQTIVCIGQKSKGLKVRL